MRRERGEVLERRDEERERWKDEKKDETDKGKKQEKGRTWQSIRGL